MTENILTQFNAKVQLVSVLDEDWGLLEGEVKHMKFSKSAIRNVPQKEWMIEGLFGAKDIVFIYGQPSTGKTFVAIDLMMTAISGKAFADTFKAVRPLTVAMVVGEGGTSIRDRLVASEDYHVTPEWADYFIFANGLQFYEDDDGEEIDSFIREWLRFEKKPLDILIIDTYAMSTIGADENSAKATGKVLSNARKIADALGCAIIFVHHTTKNGSAERGSSSLRAAADMMIEICDGRMKCTKAKHCETWKPVEFKLIPFEGSLVTEWSVKTSLEQSIFHLFSNSNKEWTANEVAEEMKTFASHMTVKNTLKAMVERKLLQSRLHNPNAVPSKSNPTIYFLNSEITEVEEW